MGSTGEQGIQGSGGLILFLNRNDNAGNPINELSVTPNSAPQNLFDINIAAGATQVASVNAAKISDLTSQPFLTSGLWDLNIFLSADTTQDKDHIQVYYAVYVIDASAMVHPQVPGTVIQDTSNPAIIPPIALPSNVIQVGGFSNYDTVTNYLPSVLEYSSSLYIPYTNIGMYMSPYLQIQIYVYNSNTKTLNGSIYYQSLF
jgi:hypothetical protein